MQSFASTKIYGSIRDVVNFDDYDDGNGKFRKRVNLCTTVSIMFRKYYNVFCIY